MIPVFLDSARKHKNLARTYKNWLPDAPYAIQTLIDAIASIDVIQQLFSLSVGMLLSRLLRMISNTKYDTAIPRNRKKELHFSMTEKNHVRQQ
jgi:hypothetical protein